MSETKRKERIMMTSPKSDLTLYNPNKYRKVI